LPSTEGDGVSDLVRFKTKDGSALYVEVEEDAFGLESIARDDAGIAEAGERLEDAIAKARPTIHAVVEALRELAPDEHQIEFGIKLSAEAGVVVAKTSVEGHFTVTLRWGREQQ
jgi:hypothetical protein